MRNIEITKLAQYVVAYEGELSEKDYSNQVNMLYGALSKLNVLSPTVFNELVEIEQNRIQKHGTSVEKRITDARSLVGEYSAIAFYLAQQSLLENKAYKVAAYLKELLSQLYASQCLNEDEKELLKNLVSEAELDFVYASGNHNVSSLRMAQVIRDYNSQNGGKR